MTNKERNEEVIMVKLEIHGVMGAIHVEGPSPTIEAEALAASIAIIRMYAETKHISFEAASLTLMQRSNKYNSMEGEFKIGED